jgi:hypothetical protein
MYSFAAQIIFANLEAHESASASAARAAQQLADSARCQLEVADKHVNELRRETGEMESELAWRRAQEEQTAQDLEWCKAEMQRRMTRLTALQQRLDTLTKDVEQSWSSAAAKEAGLGMKLVSALEEQLRVCEQEQHKAKATYEERIESLRERHAKVLASYVKHKEQGAEMMVASAAVKTCIASAKKELEKLESDRDAVTASVEAARKAAAGITAAAEQSFSAAAQLDQVIVAHRKREVQDLINLVGTLPSSITEHLDRQAQLKRAAAEEAFARLSRRLNEKRIELTELELEFERRKAAKRAQDDDAAAAAATATASAANAAAAATAAAAAAATAAAAAAAAVVCPEQHDALGQRMQPRGAFFDDGPHQQATLMPLMPFSSKLIQQLQRRRQKQQLNKEVDDNSDEDDVERQACSSSTLVVLDANVASSILCVEQGDDSALARPSLRDPSQAHAGMTTTMAGQQLPRSRPPLSALTPQQITAARLVQPQPGRYAETPGHGFPVRITRSGSPGSSSSNLNLGTSLGRDMPEPLSALPLKPDRKGRSKDRSKDSSQPRARIRKDGPVAPVGAAGSSALPGTLARALPSDLIPRPAPPTPKTPVRESRSLSVRNRIRSRSAESSPIGEVDPFGDSLAW